MKCPNCGKTRIKAKHVGSKHYRVCVSCKHSWRALPAAKDEEKSK